MPDTVRVKPGIEAARHRQRLKRKFKQAGLDETQGLSLLSLKLSDRELNDLCWSIYSGSGPWMVAKKLSKGDRWLEKWLRNKLLWAYTQPNVEAVVSRIIRAQMLADLGPATRALGKRAAEGNVHAIRLLFEASGFHNPRVQHEHSGNVTIEMVVPRPPHVDSTASELPSASSA